MDASVHRYLPDHDQEHLQEYGQCEHQHPDQQDDLPWADDQHPVPHLDDQEAAELGVRYLEAAELGDQKDPSEVVAKMWAPMEAQVQLQQLEIAELLENFQLASLGQAQQLAPVLAQEQPWQQDVQK